MNKVCSFKASSLLKFIENLKKNFSTVGSCPPYKWYFKNFNSEIWISKASRRGCQIEFYY